MPEERFMAAHLHELLAFLSEKGVATILTHGEQGFLCPSDAPVHISYIADTVILLRFFEAVGEVKLAISVTKKRTGAHERSIRELKLGPGGVGLGPPLQGMQGVLSGTPVCLGVGPRGGNGERCS
jgi:circadian clock protein KaiC